MTFFEFFGLKPAYTIDESSLKKKYLEHSRLYHPDHFALSHQEAQDHADEQSALNNKAFKILSHPESRLKYLLELKGVVQDEEIYTLDQDFLMDMLDLNDLVEEDAPAAAITLDLLEANLLEDISPVQDRYDHDTVSEDDLQLLKDYHYKKRYLLRIRDNLDKFAAR